MENYALFRRFADEELAIELTNFLCSKNIEAHCIEDKLSLDATFSGNLSLQPEYQLFVSSKDFEKAIKLVEERETTLLNQIPSDYYLFEFSSEELLELVAKADEWSNFDVALAKKILEDRNQKVDEATLKKLKEERIEVLSRPEGDQGIWITLGYVTAFLGGVIGMFIGWYLWKTTKQLPNGEKVAAFSEEDRMHGKSIFIIGSILFPLLFMIRMWYAINNSF